MDAWDPEAQETFIRQAEAIAKSIKSPSVVPSKSYECEVRGNELTLRFDSPESLAKFMREKL